MSNTLISLKEIKKDYCLGSTNVQAVRNVSLNLSASQITCLLGPSGSGKSTLLYIIGLLTKPTKGSLIIENKDISKLKEQEITNLRRNWMGFVFQSFQLLPRLNALENAALPLSYRNIPQKRSLQIARETLTDLGLKNRLRHYPSQLSGGEQQRVAIARALVCEPQVILADEPTGNLDQKTGMQILETILTLKQLGKAVVIATHDVKIAEVADQLLYIEDGVIKEKDKNDFFC